MVVWWLSLPDSMDVNHCNAREAIVGINNPTLVRTIDVETVQSTPKISNIDMVVDCINLHTNRLVKVSGERDYLFLAPRSNIRLIERIS